MKKFLEYVLAALVEHPNDLVVSELAGKTTTIFELRCNADDMGRVIGKSGKTIGAVRNLLASVAAKEGKQAVLEVVE